MFYRVTANLSFTLADEGADFYHDCQLALDKALTVNPGQPNMEQGIITLQRCYHDTSPNQPCIILDQQETPP